MMLKLSLLCFVGVLLQASAHEGFDQDKEWAKAKTIYDFHANDIHGHEKSLEKYQGHVSVIVNVASNCGLTETNYKQLQSLFEKYGESKGLRILAFPSNEFAGQEPGTNKEIEEFVKTKFNVSFDMYEKTLVNGDNAHPLYKWLKSQEAGAGTLTNEIKWNFTKFIVDKDGKVVARFGPKDEPFSMEETLNKYF